MRWGLVGHNSSGPASKRSTLNPRSETVEKSLLCRRPFQRRRLVPLDVAHSTHRVFGPGRQHNLAYFVSTVFIARLTLL